MGDGMKEKEKSYSALCGEESFFRWKEKNDSVHPLRQSLFQPVGKMQIKGVTTVTVSAQNEGKHKV